MIENVNLVWSEEDKNKLINLVKLKGNLWVEIGRLLGKPAEDCKHLHKRLTKERQKTGRLKENIVDLFLILFHRFFCGFCILCIAVSQL